MTDHHLLRLAPMLNGAEHANVFQQRSTENSRAAMRGDWNEVWDNLNRRKGSKAANDVLAVEGDQDMFARAGVAAE